MIRDLPSPRRAFAACAAALIASVSFAGLGEAKLEEALAAFRKGSEYVGIELLNDAIGMLRDEAKATPDDAEVHAKLGEALFHAQAGDEALASLERALELDPGHARATHYKGALLCLSGDLGNGEALLRRARELDPTFAPTLTLLASLEASRGDLDAAEALLRQASDLDPSDGEPIALLGSIAIERSDPGAAAGLWERALELAPKDRELMANLGQLLQNIGDLAGAKAKFDALVELEPLDWRAIAKLVQLCEALGLTEEREARRAKLYEYHAIPDMRAAMFYHDGEKRYYCRDQFETNGRSVMAFEYFDIDAREGKEESERDYPIRYTFDVLDANGETAFRITLGSRDKVSEAMRREGKLGRDERAFHLDGYYKNSHALYATYVGEPTYDVVKAKAIAAIADPTGNRLSSETLGGDLPGAQPLSPSK